MRIVHIAHKYGVQNTGGAAIAATRLHRALIDAGIDSHYVCVQRIDDGMNVHELPAGWRRCLFMWLTKFTRCIWKFTPYRKSICLNLIPLFGLRQLLRAIKPDVIHVQWINADVCSFEQLAHLPYPLVFNLHDLFPLNAIEPHPKHDERFAQGFNSRNANFLERWLFERKKIMIGRISQRVSFIAPSQWTAAMVNRSVIGNGHRIVVVPNVIDPIFNFDRELVLHTSTKTILFGAYGGRGNDFKGWDDLMRALEFLQGDDVVVKVFGEDAETYSMGTIRVEFIGKINSPLEMKKIYHNADVLAFASRQETFGMTKLEAMRCGLPVVAFDRTACSEGIVHCKNGWVVRDGDIKGYAAGLKFWLRRMADGGILLREDIAKSAMLLNNEELIVATYLKNMEGLCK